MSNKLLLVLVIWMSSLTGLMAGEHITITSSWGDCAENVQLFQFDGFTFRPVQKGKQEGDKVIFTLKKDTKAFYYIGVQNTQLLPVILGEEENVEIVGNCKNTSASVIQNSTINKEYSDLKLKMQNFVQRTGRLNTQLRRAKSEEDRQGIMDKMKELDAEKIALINQFKTTNSLFYHILTLNTYVSYQYNNNGKHKNELDYFANEFFQFADFSSPEYNGLPWMYEGFKSYAGSVSGPQITTHQNRAILENTLSRIPDKSLAKKLAFGGVLAVLEKNQHANFAHFAKKVIRMYGEGDAGLTTALQQKIKKLRGITQGGEAPDFTGKTPDGMELSLSDFRGKVVLLDFWASWCGPCRRENPNVVKLYEKYKDKGFDILGVSLDSKKQRWVDAIKKDKLDWSHVSDLKGWQSQMGKLYGVRSIPFTVLIDREGNIIATRLRGAALERKLEEIFGE